jgi:hypothetical protein
MRKTLRKMTTRRTTTTRKNRTTGHGIAKVISKSTNPKSRKNKTSWYNKVCKNVYSYTRKDGKLTYRATRLIKGKTHAATFNSLRDCKAWLKMLMPTPR